MRIRYITLVFVGVFSVVLPLSFALEYQVPLVSLYSIACYLSYEMEDCVRVYLSFRKSISLPFMKKFGFPKFKDLTMSFYLNFHLS